MPTTMTNLGIPMSQLTKDAKTRLMYLENKDGDIDGHVARIGWVTFSRSGRSVYYRGRTLTRMKGGGVMGNYACNETGDEFWVSGVKKRGSNVHWASPVDIHVDDDAVEAYHELRMGSESGSCL